MRYRLMLAVGLSLLIAQPAWSVMPAVPVIVRSDAANFAGKQRPADFALYGQSSIDANANCVVGADQALGDGVLHAAVYRVDPATGMIAWNRTLQVPGDQKGSRATHCFVSEDSLYVVIQRDLLSQNELPQTFLSIARLDAENGQLLASGHLNPPIEELNVAEARFSASINQGPGQIRIENGVVKILAEVLVLAYSDNQSVPPPRAVEIRVDAEHLQPIQ